MSETPSGIPPFTCNGTTFTCMTADDGTFVWRSADHDLAVGRIGAFCWARAHGELVGRQFSSIKQAMEAVATKQERRAA